MNVAVRQTAKETELLESVEAITEQVAEIKIVDDPSFTAAEQFLKRIGEYEKAVHDELDPDIKKAHDLHKSMTGRRKKLLDKAEAAKDIVQRAMGDYVDEMKRIEREQEIALEAQLRAERAADIEEEAAILITKGETAAAMARLEAAETMPMPTPKIPSLAPEKSKGTQVRKTWHFEVTDASLLPREYLCPDQKAIKAMVNAKKDDCSIPGVKVWYTTKVYAKAGAE